MITCRHYNSISLLGCDYCFLESVDYYGYNPEIYNLGFEMIKHERYKNDVDTRPLRSARFFNTNVDFSYYYNLAKIELRKQKIKSIL